MSLLQGAYVARCPHCGAGRAAAWVGLGDADRQARRWRRDGYDVAYMDGSVGIGGHVEGCPEAQGDLAQADMLAGEAST